MFFLSFRCLLAISCGLFKVPMSSQPSFFVSQVVCLFILPIFVSYSFSLLLLRLPSFLFVVFFTGLLGRIFSTLEITMASSSVVVGISDPDDSIRFVSYESVANVDLFREPEKHLKVPFLAPFYWCQRDLVGQYVS